jgi:Uma2 family endonuclease
MGMPAPQANWTADMARALPDDGNRYEVLDGELHVSPAPSWDHQWIVQAFQDLIKPYVRRNRLGWTIMSPADIEFSPKRLVQPDLFVVPDTGTGRPRSWKESMALRLVVEVISPSTEWTDRNVKRPLFQSEGVPEFWIVDGPTRSVERWRPGDDRPEVVTDVLEWQPQDGIDPLRIALPELFADALD